MGVPIRVVSKVTTRKELVNQFTRSKGMLGNIKNSWEMNGKT